MKSTIVIRRFFVIMLGLALFAACKENIIEPTNNGGNVADTTQQGRDDTDTAKVIPPTVNFKITDEGAGQVSLKDLSKNGYGHPRINWGDDTKPETMPADSVVHQYKNAGNYTITFIVFDIKGKKYQQTKDINLGSAFNIDFSLEYVEPDAARLINKSVGAATSTLNWGDGSNDEVVTKNEVMHHYSTNGVYSVTLTIENTGGKKLVKSQSLKVRVIALNHSYTAVFPDDPNNPKYLYFTGYTGPQTTQLVWKFDVGADSVLAGYPKRVIDEFNNLPSQFDSTIISVVWLQSGAFFTGGGYVSSYDFGSGAFSSTQKITDYYAGWPIATYPNIEGGLYAANGSAYLFSGGAYFKFTNGVLVSGPTPVMNGWPGFQSTWTDINKRVLNGVYYNSSDGWMTLFSGDEMSDYNFNNNDTKGPFKIRDKYPGL